MAFDSYQPKGNGLHLSSHQRRATQALEHSHNHPLYLLQRNAYVERYNRTVGHEWQDIHIFETIGEVQQIATEWLWSYNNERPNMGNGGMTPARKLKMAE